MKVKKVLLTSVFALCLILSVLLVTSKEVNYALFSGLFTLFAGFMLIQTMKFDKNPQSKYQSTVKNILKTYDVILVEIDNLPDISDRKFVNTTSFKDMVNIEYEFRKPVYYVHDEDSYDFMRTLGAKKYVVQIGNECYSTIAGVSKKAGQKYFNKNGINAFRIGAVIEDSGHLIAFYNDDEIHEIEIEGVKMVTASNVALIDDTYTIGITNDYWHILNEIGNA